jgi:DNA-binding LacI/PurR family transcriptional regulator
MTNEGFFTRKKGQGTFLTEMAVKSSDKGTAAATELLYISFNNHAPDKTIMPFTWFVSDEMQKGIINTYNGPIKIINREAMLNSGKINAIVFEPDKEIIRKLCESGSRYIFINHSNSRDLIFNMNSISREIFWGIYELMTYLIMDLGHRNIGFIGGDLPDYFAPRYAGYEISLRTYNIPAVDDYIIRNLKGGEEDGYNAMKKFLSLKKPPTAVFADTDLKAMGAIKAIKEAGLRVPADISVAGFNDMPGASTFEPPLTTVRSPNYEIGVRAAEMLLKRIQSNTDIKSETLKTIFVERSSCCRVKFQI